MEPVSRRLALRTKTKTRFPQPHPQQLTPLPPPTRSLCHSLLNHSCQHRTHLMTLNSILNQLVLLLSSLAASFRTPQTRTCSIASSLRTRNWNPSARPPLCLFQRTCDLCTAIHPYLITPLSQAPLSLTNLMKTVKFQITTLTNNTVKLQLTTNALRTISLCQRPGPETRLTPYLKQRSATGCAVMSSQGQD